MPRAWLCPEELVSDGDTLVPVWEEVWPCSVGTGNEGPCLAGDSVFPGAKMNKVK